MNWPHVGSSSGPDLDDARDLVISLENFSDHGHWPHQRRCVVFFQENDVPICKFCCSSVHFCRCCSVVRYSLDHRFQKKLMACCRCWNLRTSDTSAESSSSISGTASSGRSIRRWAGVRAGKSLGSLDGAVSGREFIMASIWFSNVVNSSRGSVVLPVVFIRWRFKDLTAASHRPPKWGERGGIVSHCILWYATKGSRAWLIFCSASILCSSSSLWLPVKVRELSL